MTLENTRPIFRFAPSPNGYLHLGHAFSALYSWQMAKENNGIFLLRIEDIDQERSRQIYVDQILDDLNWLGLSWEEPILRQTTRLKVYEKALDVLKRKDLVYPSFLTRKDIKNIAPHKNKDPHGAPLIDKTDEVIGARENAAAWRLDMRKARSFVEKNTSFTEHNIGPKGETGQQTIDPSIWGNVILGRKNMPSSYHLSVVIDDAFQNVSHVTRGQDLFYATHIHVLLQRLLGFPTPLYFHHPLISNNEGRKLSKSALDKSLRSLRAEGVTPQDIRNNLPLKF